MSRSKSSSNSIREIAKAANVSIASVSRALNGKPGVSEALREKISQISATMEYEPSLAARELNRGKSAIVAISMERSSWELSPFYDILFQELTRALHASGMVPKSYRYEQTDKIAAEACCAILLGLQDAEDRAERLQQLNVPYVSLETSVSPFSLLVDGANAIKRLTNYLIGKGRKRIAFLSASNMRIGEVSRILGYRKALTEANLDPLELIFPHQLNRSLGSYRYIRRLSETDGLNFDAVVCDTDEDALGVVEALIDLGVEVPEEIAVTGFDDLPLLAQDLTTVKQDFREIAQHAVALVDKALRQDPECQIVLEPELVFRHTA